MSENCDFDFFKVDSDIDSEIFIHGISSEIREIIGFIGTPVKTSKKIDCKYSRFKEWPQGRKPIPLSKLKTLISLCDSEFSEKIKKKIIEKELFISTRYSKHKVLLPKTLSLDLSYVVGLLLGDGSLAGNSSNKKGNWNISVFFDNKEHMLVYKKVIQEIFLIEPNFAYRQNSYYDCYFASKVVHWFFRTFFELKNGAKDSFIEIPKLILYSSDEKTEACIAGLIDSDGTVITNRKAIKYASTSEKIVNQMKTEFENRGFAPKLYSWKKAPKYKLLYTLRIGRRHELLKFAECINLRHPIKRHKLKQIKATNNSPVV